MKQKAVKTTLKVATAIALACCLLLGGVFFYFKSSGGQKLLSKWVLSSLAAKLKTPVSGRISYGFPRWVQIDSLLLIDQSADTLLFSKRAFLGIDMLDLIDNQLNISKVELDGAKVNLHKVKNRFNFQYILDAFASNPNTKPSVGFQYNLPSVILHNSRLVYTDLAEGHRLSLFIENAKTGFEALAPTQSIFKLKSFVASGIDVRGKVGGAKTKTAKSEASSLQFAIGDINLNRVSWAVAMANQTTQAKGVGIWIKPQRIDLSKSAFDINRLDVLVPFFEFKQAGVAIRETQEFNAQHVVLKNAGLSLLAMRYRPNGLSFRIADFFGKEQSGLHLKKTSADVKLSGQAFEISKLKMLTDGSELMAEVRLNVDPQTKVIRGYWADISKGSLNIDELFFANRAWAKLPALGPLKGKEVNLAGSVRGDLKLLNLDQVQVKLPQKTALLLSGTVTNFSKPFLNLSVLSLASTSADLMALLPSGTLPSSLHLPRWFSMKGRVEGYLSALKMSLEAQTEFGAVALKTHIDGLGSASVLAYVGQLNFKNFNVGQLNSQADIGKATGYLAFKGHGADNRNLVVETDGFLNSIEYQDKTYQNISFEGQLAQQIIHTNLVIDDPKAKVSWKGDIDLGQENIAIVGNSHLDFLDLKALGWSTIPVEIRGQLDVQNLVVNTQDPKIDIEGKHLMIYKGDKFYPIAQLSLHTSSQENNRNIVLKTPFMQVSANGNFNYSQLKEVILAEINNYFHIPDFKPSTTQNQYLFKIDGKLDYDPIFEALMPGLHDFSTVDLHALLRSDGPVPISGKITIPYLLYDSLQIHNTTFNYLGDRKALQFNFGTDRFISPAFRLRQASLIGKLANNVADFRLAVRDSLHQEIHALHGFLQSINNRLRLSFDEEGAKLFYHNWAGNPAGYVEYGSDGLFVNNVVFTSGKQIMRLNNFSNVPNGPISVFTQHIDLNALAQAFVQDAGLVGGFLDADVQVEGYMDGPVSYFGDFSVNQFMFKNIALGKFSGKTVIGSNGALLLTSTIASENASVRLMGSYNLQKSESLDVRIVADSVRAETLQPFSTGILKDISGSLAGMATVKGSLEKPEVTGHLSFRDFAFVLVEAGAKMRIKNQKLDFKNQQLDFKDFEVLDLKAKKMLVNGHVRFSDMPNYSYNLQIDTKDFAFVNAQLGDNELFFGKGYFDSHVKLTGKNLDFVLNGDVRVGAGTDLTLLMPDDSQIGTDLENTVTFMDFKNPTPKPKPKKAQQGDLDFANSVNLNVEIADNASLHILMDQVTGDLLSVKGNGKFNTGFDNKGNLFILGRYDILDGRYNLTYQVIKKEFVIHQNSKSHIAWSGDPLAAQLEITAEHTLGKKSLANYPFSSEDLKKSKFNLPLRVDLLMQGVLSNPKINFEMVLNEADVGAYKDAFQKDGFKLADTKGIKAEGILDVTKAELIKDQAILMLMTGAFSLSSLGGNLANVGNYENLAREKVSDLISSQLNKYASGIIKGLDVDLGVQSAYNLADDSRNTNLSLGLKKKFANERLILSVGKNFELENKNMRSDEIFDNVQANWVITKDGRYRLNIFRKNLNQMVVEGSVIETGLGFIVAIDYETWKELMKKK
jgi:translocation and assembly module TamB